jgi:hypothetical protein
MRTFERNQLNAALRAVYLSTAAASMIWIIANYATASAVTIPLMLLGGVFLVLTIAAAINAFRKDRFLRGSSVGVLSVGTQRFLRLVGLTIGIPPILYCAFFALLVITFNGKPNTLNVVDHMVSFEMQTFGKTVVLDYINAWTQTHPVEPLPEPPLVSTELQPMESDPCGTTVPYYSNSGSENPWYPVQATGKPDTTGYGDITTAWASATKDEQNEWLEVDFGEDINPSQIEIYETFNPGALFRIDFYGRNDEVVASWTGPDPTSSKENSGISKIPVQTHEAVTKATLFLNSKDVKGWNEIDAVGLRDTKGDIHWAVDAKASTTYGVAE